MVCSGASAIPPDGDRAVGSQAMRYAAAIMALCWPVTSSAVKFAVDLYGAFPCQGAFRPGWAVDL